MEPVNKLLQMKSKQQKQLRVLLNENHVAGIGQPPTDGKNRLCQLIHGGFLHSLRDSTMPRFFQQRPAELLSLIIGKSQGFAY